jgi:hypothetical protein
MAKSKIKIIDGLLEEVTKLSMTDDDALFTAREWLGDKLDSYRATVLRKYIADKRNDISGCYQKIDCLDPECLGIECDISGITINLKADLWKINIPELLSIRKAIKYFGPFDLQNPYTHVELFSLTNNESRWGRPIKEFARIGNVLYYQNFDKTRKYTLIGIFANPSSVCGFNDNDPYPLPKELEQQLELLIKKDLYQMLGIPVDYLDDGSDVPQQKQTNERQSK